MIVTRSEQNVTVLLLCGWCRCFSPSVLLSPSSISHSSRGSSEAHVNLMVAHKVGGGREEGCLSDGILYHKENSSPEGPSALFIFQQQLVSPSFSAQIHFSSSSSPSLEGETNSPLLAKLHASSEVSTMGFDRGAGAAEDGWSVLATAMNVYHLSAHQ